VSRPVTSSDLRNRKRSKGSEPIVMVTAYDEPSARLADAAGVDLLLVGDSVANTVLGYPDSMHVTMDDMARHTAAVARAEPRALIVGDLPWLSYHTGVRDAVRNAGTLVRAGAQCVKLEGGSVRVPVVEAIVDAQIPVMGHLGLTPQSLLAMGGYKVQGKELEAAKLLIQDAHSLEDAGCIAVVLEGIPDVLAERITKAIGIPTIGIGAGPSTDGQVLVFHDLLGLGDRTPPKFVRAYADLGPVITDAIARFAADVRSSDFPGEAETYAATGELREALGE
jgi:3-methyl-2-oxobutanoate hydroxymethyltransferase